MTSVVKGGFGPPSATASNNGTEFINILAPPQAALDGYDNSIPCSQQTITVPPTFRDAMAVREEVYGEQGIPLEAEFDEDDARSWHWVVYASVATSSGSPPKNLRFTTPSTPAGDARRASAAAIRVPVATIRLIPPPHGPNKYLDAAPKGKKDTHPDADPPASKGTHTSEPYVKLGRLAVLAAYRNLGLSKLLINAVFDFARTSPDKIYRPPSPTALEIAQIKGHKRERDIMWQGLVMIHAQADLKGMWERHGFREELVDEATGEVVVGREERWMEEGIEHVAMWRRVGLEPKRLSVSVEN